MRKHARAIDLFAGPGGLSLGLIDSGFDVVGAVEYDKSAAETYEHNLGDSPVMLPIQEFGPERMEERLGLGCDIDLIAGGPPCPSFSLMGRSKISSLIADGTWEGSDHSHSSVDDRRRFLFYNFLEYVAHFEPKYFLMENVSGMSSYVWKENGEEVSMIDKIEQSFGALGYSVESQILNAAHFGVPQNRKRIFFLGSREGEKKPEWPQEVDYRISSYQAIQDLGRIDTETGLPLRDRLIPMGECRGGRHVLGFLRYSRRRSVLEGGLASRRWRELTLHRSRPVNPRDIGIFPHLKSGENGEGRILYSDLDPEQISFPPPWRWNKSGGVVWNGRRMGNRRVYKWYDPSKFGDKMRRIRGDMPAPTVVAHLAKDGYMFIHPKENRTISVREAARFQSFPDAFEFRGAVSSQFRQVGNAVPPLLAKAIGEMIRKVS